MEVSEIKHVNKFNYMLLARLKADCEYYLGWGARNKKWLWAGDELEQIREMKKLYYNMPYHQRPEWLSETKLKYYCMKLTNKNINEIK